MINTHINNPKRHVFTFAHELGHYFLEHKPEYIRDGATGFWCSVDDVLHGNRRKEQEANAFAVELLMPEIRFLPMMLGAAVDFTLVRNLARMFHVSQQACGYRILDFTRTPCAIIYSENDGRRISGLKVSRAGKNFLRGLKSIPENTYAHAVIASKHGQENFMECDPARWLTKHTPLTRLYSCTRGKFEKGVAMTILRWS